MRWVRDMRKLTYKQLQTLLENQTRVTENEMLSPKDRSVADDEMIEVVPLQAVLSLIHQLAQEDIVIIKNNENE